MTITSDTAVWNFVFSGATGDFSVPAPVLSTEDLDCYALSIADGTKYVPTFTIELASDFSGATVHVTAGGVASDTFHVRRVATGLQPTPFPDGGRFPASATERMLDRICTYILAQQLDFGRAVRADPSDTAFDALPPAAQRLGKFLGFDPVTGAPVVAEGVDSGTLISAAMAAVVGQGTLALARAAMGVPGLAANAFTGAQTLPGDASGVLEAVPRQQMLRGDRSAIWGLTYVTGTDAANDIDVAAGGCMSDDGLEWIEIAATTKQLDVAAAADNGATPSGMLGPAAAVGNNHYIVYAIKNPTTLESRVFAEKEGTAPTLPSGFTRKRAFGFIKRTGGANLALTTSELSGGGLRLKYLTGRLDIASVNTVANARTVFTLTSLPQTFSVKALLRAGFGDGAEAGAGWLGPISEVDAAPSGTAVPLANFAWPAGGNDYKDLDIETSATGTIGARSNVAGTVDGVYVLVRGLEWSRR